MLKRMVGSNAVMVLVLMGCAVLFHFSGGAYAGGGPENVALVVNDDSWASKAIANEYIRLRNIPSCNVIYIKDIGALDYMDVEDFRRTVLNPILTAIRDRGLEAQIDYIVYSADFPCGIWLKTDMFGQQWPVYFSDMGSITGMTYLYQPVLAGDPRTYLSLNANRYYRSPLPWAKDKEWTPQDVTIRKELLAALGRLQSLKTMLKKAQGRRPTPAAAENDAKAAQRDEQRRKMNEAFKTEAAKAGFFLAELEKTHPNSHSVHMVAARLAAVTGQREKVIAELKAAFDAGSIESGTYTRYKEFKNILAGKSRAAKEKSGAKNDYDELEDYKRKTVFDTQTSRGFRHSVVWGKNGEPTTEQNGPQYYLSVMLPHTSGWANSLDEALACLRRSVSADGVRPSGTVYFARNKNIRSTTREWAFWAAAANLRKLGVKAEITDGIMPENRKDVCGAMVGFAVFDWRKSGSAILPGAICEHLTSLGGPLWRKGHTLLSEFIRHGAAGASGTVAEPYAIQAKFPDPFIHLHYARGCSLAEAFYQSVRGPYQLLIAGDPLCRPWAEIPQVTIGGIVPQQKLKGSVTLVPKPAAGEDNVARYELFVDGVRRGRCGRGESFKLDTTGLCDGYHELRVVAVTSGPVETQGLCLVPFFVANGGSALKAELLTANEMSWNDAFQVRLRLKGAKETALLHNGRVVATAGGEEGFLETDVFDLGLGPVRLEPVAWLDDERKTQVRGRPIALNIIPPQPLPPQKPAKGARLADGLSLNQPPRSSVAVTSIKGAKRIDGRDMGRKEREYVKLNTEYQQLTEDKKRLKQDAGWLEERRTKLREQLDAVSAKLGEYWWDRKAPQWLRNAGVEPGRPFVLEGYFSVPEQGVYQFQVRTNLDVRIEVDGKPLPNRGGRFWKFMPVSLQAGMHKFSLRASGDKVPLLDVRFGGPGARKVDGKRFRHVVQ